MLLQIIPNYSRKNKLFHELTHALVFDPDLLINLGMAKKEDSLVYIKRFLKLAF